MPLDDQNSAPSFISIANAEAAINDYRTTQSLNVPTHVQIYLMQQFQDMIGTLITYTSQIVLPAPYEWRIGLSPMHVDLASEKRLAICILPTIVNKGDFSDTHEFIASKAAKDNFYDDYYVPLLQLIDNDTPGGTFIFDEGGVWP